MIKRLILTGILNLIFAWSLYLLGWNHPDIYAFLLVIPLVISVSLTLSMGHWAMWAQENYGKHRIILNVMFNLLFAWLCYFYGWYDLVTFPTFGNGIDMILLLAIGAVFIHWALGNLQIQQTGDIEKRKRDSLDKVLRDLSDSDLLRLKARLADGSIDEEMLYQRLYGDDSEISRESR